MISILISISWLLTLYVSGCLAVVIFMRVFNLFASEESDLGKFTGDADAETVLLSWFGFLVLVVCIVVYFINKIVVWFMDNYPKMLRSVYSLKSKSIQFIKFLIDK